MHHRERVVEEMLGHGQLRRPGIETHRVIVNLLDGIGVPQRIAGIIHHVAFHQAENRGAGLGVEDVLDVPDHMIGNEGIAV